VPRSAAAPALVVVAVVASVAGADGAAGLFLLAAIPFAALTVLDGVTSVVGGTATAVRVGLRVAALALVLAGATTGRTGVALLSLAVLALQPLDAILGRRLVTRRLSSRRVRGRRTAASPTP
jgi:hypothetical protein